MLIQPVSPGAIAATTNTPAPASDGAAEPAQVIRAPAPVEDVPQLSPLQRKIGTPSLRDDQSRISLLQMADDATQSLADILGQMKGLLAQIGDATLDTATRSLARQQFNSLSSHIDDMTSRVRRAAGGGEAAQLDNAIAAMASALSAVTSNHNGTSDGPGSGDGSSPSGGDAVYINTLSEALDSITVVRAMILAAAQTLYHPELGASNLNIGSGAGDAPQYVGSITQDVNIGIDQALVQAGSGVLKDGPTISALVTFLLQSGIT